jgi:hypothetical protein
MKVMGNKLATVPFVKGSTVVLRHCHKCIGKVVGYTWKANDALEYVKIQFSKSCLYQSGEVFTYPTEMVEVAP